MDDDLRAALDDLRTGIDRFDAGTEDRDHLAELIGRVEAHLDPDADDDEGVIDHARGSAVRFEVDHPDLSRLVRRIVDTLSASGL